LRLGLCLCLCLGLCLDLGLHGLGMKLLLNVRRGVCISHGLRGSRGQVCVDSIHDKLSRGRIVLLLLLMLLLLLLLLLPLSHELRLGLLGPLWLGLRLGLRVGLGRGL